MGSDLSLGGGNRGAAGVLMVMGISAVAISAGWVFGNRYLQLKKVVQQISVKTRDDRRVQDLVSARADFLKEGAPPNDLWGQCALPKATLPLPQVIWPPLAGTLGQIETSCKRLDELGLLYVVRGALVGSPQSTAGALVDLNPKDFSCGIGGHFQCPAGTTEESPTRWGKGTVESPYCLCTATQIETIGGSAALMNANFKVMQDIDFAATAGPEGNRSIGPNFTGTFDGGGFALSSFRVRSGPTGRGLFTQLGSWSKPTALVRNLFIKDAHIQAAGRAGIVADVAKRATLQNVRVSGKVLVPQGAIQQDFVGALVGEAIGVIIDGAEALNINAIQPSEIRSQGSFVGGLVGYMGSFVLQESGTGARPSGYPAAAPWPVELGGVLRNVGARKVIVQGKGFVGGLVGKAYDSIVQRAQVQEVTIAAGNGGFTGGIIGMYAGDPNPPSSLQPTRELDALLCFRSQVASGSGNGVGALIGKAAFAQVRSSYSDCRVDGGPAGYPSQQVSGVGGLVGVGEALTIKQSESSGEVLGGLGPVGGVLGNAICPNEGYECSLVGGEVCVPQVQPLPPTPLGAHIEQSRFSGRVASRLQTQYGGGLLGQANLLMFGECKVLIEDSSVVGQLQGEVVLPPAFDSPRWGGLVGRATSGVTSAGQFEMRRSFFAGEFGSSLGGTGPFFDCVGGSLGDYPEMGQPLAAEWVYYRAQEVPKTNPGGSCLESDGTYSDLLAIDPRIRGCPSSDPATCPAVIAELWNRPDGKAFRRVTDSELRLQSTYDGFSFSDGQTQGPWKMPDPVLGVTPPTDFNDGIPIPSWCIPVLGGANRACRPF